MKKEITVANTDGFSVGDRIEMIKPRESKFEKFIAFCVGVIYFKYLKRSLNHFVTNRTEYLTITKVTNHTFTVE